MELYPRESRTSVNLRHDAQKDQEKYSGNLLVSLYCETHAPEGEKAWGFPAFYRMASHFQYLSIDRREGSRGCTWVSAPEIVLAYDPLKQEGVCYDLDFFRQYRGY